MKAMNNYVLKKADIDASPGKEYNHPLNNNAIRTTRSLGDQTGLTGLGFHLVSVNPGYESTEFHTHHYEDECAYVLSGTGEVIIDETVVKIEAGDFIGYRKGGLPHTMKSTGDEPLVCIVAGERRAHDIVDYPKCGKRLYNHPSETSNMVEHKAIEHDRK